MKFLSRHVVLGVCIATLVGGGAAQRALGAAASTYKISILSVELCSDAACSSSTVLGSTPRVFDISSASVGTSLGSYASTSSLPYGKTYTYIRVSMSRAITIKGSVLNANVSGGAPGGVSCGTGGGTDATSGTLAGVGVGTDGGAPADMVVYVPNELAFAGGTTPAAGTYAAAGVTLSSGTTMSVLVALPAPFTVGKAPPTVKVDFSTANALGAFNNGGACAMYPLAPGVRVLITYR